mmetsp:Transcript_23925/g.52259  ORF Transcript_23925/g.52259 Transcript_23925/m.52259 type:complete len:254 (-) Transcript_23925:51-812(-)
MADGSMDPAVEAVRRGLIPPFLSMQPALTASGVSLGPFGPVGSSARPTPPVGGGQSSLPYLELWGDDALRDSFSLELNSRSGRLQARQETPTTELGMVRFWSGYGDRLGSEGDAAQAAVVRMYVGWLHEMFLRKVKFSVVSAVDKEMRRDWASAGAISFDRARMDSFLALAVVMSDTSRARTGGGSGGGGDDFGGGNNRRASAGGGRGGSASESELCFRFNAESGCRFGKTCKFDHVCSECGESGHGRSTCEG